MAHTPETRSKVRSAYIFDGLCLEEAAAKAGVGERTANRWKAQALDKGDDWDKAKTASRLAGDGVEAVARAVLEDFLLLFQTTMADVKAGDMKPADKVDAISRLSDAYTKTTKAIQRSAPELSRLAIASEVLQLLARFVRERYPKHAPALLEVLEPFGEEVSIVYG